MYGKLLKGEELLDPAENMEIDNMDTSFNGHGNEDDELDQEV